MIIKIYDENPNVRDVRRVADCIREGGIVVLPTDSLYAFVCSMQHKATVERLARLKGFSLKQAKFSLLCADISQLSEYVRPLDKETFALLKSALPGAPTFIMDANNNVGRNYQNANKTIGMRVPANPIAHAIIEEVGEPLIATSVRIPDADYDKPRRHRSRRRHRRHRALDSSQLLRRRTRDYKRRQRVRGYRKLKK